MTICARDSSIEDGQINIMPSGVVDDRQAETANTALAMNMPSVT